MLTENWPKSTTAAKVATSLLENERDNGIYKHLAPFLTMKLHSTTLESLL